jgi:hypothetical protein
LFALCHRHFERRRAAWLAGFAFGIALVSAHSGLATEIAVTVADGRTFTAEVDARSDAERLWLRFGTARTTILRPIDWSSVVGVRRDGVELTAAELKREIAAAANAVSSVVTTRRLVEKASDRTSPVQPSSVSLRNSGGGGLQLWRLPDANSPMSTEPAPIVRSLSVDAYLGNWDSDVDSDGLVVNFAALDDFGDAVPVNGTLEVELIGERQPPYSRGNAFPVLGRWTQAVNASDGVSPSGYSRVRLPFQAFHPDYWNSLPWFALAHVRLIVPGQGTFEASVDAVRLRGFTPVRDRMESAAGTRFAPTEQTSRSKRLSARGSTD